MTGDRPPALEERTADGPGDRRGPPPQDPATAMIAAMDGAEVPGGCGWCDAVQVVEAHVRGEANLHAVHVYHADGCPWLAARRGPE